MRAAPKTGLSAKEAPSEQPVQMRSIAELPLKDKQLLIDALAALLRERSIAYEIASSTAASAGSPTFDVRDFALTDILRLIRTLQCS